MSVMKRMGVTDIKKLDDATNVIPEINKMTSPQSIKTTLSALYVTTGHDKYKQEMIKYSEIVNKLYAQKKTKVERQESNMTGQKLKDIFESYKKKVKLFPNDSKLYQDYVIIALTPGVFIAPRRNLDWCAFKVNNIDKAKDNYISGNHFVFNKFKTAKYVQPIDRMIEIPKGLKTILSKWEKLNTESDYLLHNRSGLFSSSSFSKKLQTLYGDGVSADTIRSLYLTNKYKTTADEILKMQKTAKEMGTSENSILSYYIKNDQN